MSILDKLLAAMTVVLASAATLLYGSWAMSVFWGWFVVPIFHLPGLTILHVYGLGITINLVILTLGYDPGIWPCLPGQRKKGRAFLHPTYTQSTCGQVCSITLILSLGWLVHTFLWS